MTRFAIIRSPIEGNLTNAVSPRRAARLRTRGDRSGGSGISSSARAGKDVLVRMERENRLDRTPLLADTRITIGERDRREGVRKGASDVLSSAKWH